MKLGKYQLGGMTDELSSFVQVCGRTTFDTRIPKPILHRTVAELSSGDSQKLKKEDTYQGCTIP